MSRFSALKFALVLWRQLLPTPRNQVNATNLLNGIQRRCASNAFSRQAHNRPRQIVVRAASNGATEVTVRASDDERPTGIGLSEGEEQRPFDALSESVELKLDDIPTMFPKSFTLAAYVNRSETLKQFVKLGVDLSKWDRTKDVPELILKLDFENDIKKYIRFLHDVGVHADELGHFFTKNPYIFQTPIEDLQVRINYLQSKNLPSNDIARIVSKAPLFLTFSTVNIDRRLGFLQKRFRLTGNELRSLIARNPKFALWDMDKIRHRHFLIKEELGFTGDEIKTLLLTKPKMWMIGLLLLVIMHYLAKDGRLLVERFMYLHNEMGIPHVLMVSHPGALLRRKFSLEQRHLFLKALGRAQYDPTKEMYVSLKALTSGSDADFCRDVAKTSVQKFNEFLKTL